MRIVVLGGGSWGTALAHAFAHAGHSIRLFVRDVYTAEHINSVHKNPRYLKSHTIHENVLAITDFSQLHEQDVFVLAIPAQSLRAFLRAIRDYLPDNCILINTAKGLESETGKSMGIVVAEELSFKNPSYAILSGPSFADEVMLCHPTAVVLGAEDKELGTRLRHAFSSEFFRCYSGTDIYGIELGGAIKNIMAIAVGLCDGLGFGHNSRAALITRSLAEMSRFGVSCGANAITFMGLSGLGDLILTANGNLSRNRQVGLRLGQGEKLDFIVKDLGMVAEGVKTTQAVYNMTQEHKVRTPIIHAMYKILYEDMPPRECAKSLMTGDLRDE